MPKELPTELFAGKRCVSISAGGSHSLVLTQDGTVYQLGYGSHGMHQDWWWVHDKLRPARVGGALEAVRVKVIVRL